jgi:hypothetical protein
MQDRSAKAKRVVVLSYSWLNPEPFRYRRNPGPRDALMHRGPFIWALSYPGGVAEPGSAEIAEAVELAGPRNGRSSIATSETSAKARQIAAAMNT